MNYRTEYTATKGQTFNKFVGRLWAGFVRLNCPILRFRRPILPRA